MKTIAAVRKPSSNFAVSARRNANSSSGIEPIFQLEGTRRVIGAGGEPQSLAARDHAWAAWQARHARAPPPGIFVTAREVSAQDQLEMQAALQPFVDSAISKTVALPDDFPAAAVPELFRTAWRLGLKGCTIHRAQARAGVVTK